MGVYSLPVIIFKRLLFLRGEYVPNSKMYKKFVYLLAFVLSVIYLVWRGMYTLPWSESLFAICFGIALWVSEIVSNVTAVILIWSKNKVKSIEKPLVEDGDYPDIDVLIVTHNEDVPLLLKTVNAACHMKYPDPSKVHIYLSDDKNRPEVKALADKFHIGYIGLEGNKHAKSGNINNALAHTSSPLVATFDADMIPYSDFLLETVPYFIGNKKEHEADEKVKPLGLVQTPQSFYNADLFQFNLFSEKTLTNEQDFFSREVNILNNAHDAAIYTGSNTVISRQAIEDVGGFPTDTITEDFQLGALINTKGYKNISTIEPMASGLTPTDVPSVLKQRIRWGRGVVQSIKNIHLLTNKNLTLQQKMVFLNGFLYWWSFIRRLLYIFAPILFTVFDIMVVDTNFWTLLLFWLPSYYFVYLSMQDMSTDIRTQRWGEVQETIFAPYLVLPVFLQTIGIKETKFKVTNKAATQTRKDLLYVIPHAIMLVLTIIGLVKFNYGKFGSEIFYGSVITFWLLTHFINLLFSVLFFLGRPLYRKAERFQASYDVKVSYKGADYNLKTINISESGLSFVSEYPIYFPADADLSFDMTKENYHAHLEGKIVRVISERDQWVYGVALDEISEKDYLQYLQIIYDGFNRSLPQVRDPWMTPFDHLIENIHRRYKQAGKHTDFVSKTPVLWTNHIISLDEFDVVLHRFNFETMTMSAMEDLSKRKNWTVMIDEIDFQLAYDYQNQSGEYIFKVTNLQEVMMSPHFENLINKWMSERGESLYVANHFAS